MSRLDLIRTELETLWDADARGRLLDAHHVVVGATGDGCTAALGADLPDVLAAELSELLAELPADGGEPDEPPAAVSRCADVLRTELGAVVLTSALGYLVPPDLEFRRADDTTEIVRSDHGTARGLRAARPGTWDDAEWSDLLAGRLGPWALALDGGRVVAVCHTPVASAGGAEAGVWTRPGFRGRGLAAAFTAAWAKAFAALPGERRLFYSTTAGNRSSQRVAERLGLLPVGRLWKLSRPGAEGRHAQRAWPGPSAP